MKNQKLQFALLNSHLWSIYINTRNIEFPEKYSNDKEIEVNLSNENLRNWRDLTPPLISVIKQNVLEN